MRKYCTNEALLEINNITGEKQKCRVICGINCASVIESLFPKH